jgi:hypothetical protein
VKRTAFLFLLALAGCDVRTATSTGPSQPHWTAVPAGPTSAWRIQDTSGALQYCYADAGTVHCTPPEVPKT